MTMKKHHQRRSRWRRRGAALVEAAVVIPVMLVFLGCIMFVHKSYAMKLNKQHTTRSGAMYYASHACKGDPKGIPAPIAESADPGIPAGPAEKNAGKVGQSNSPGARAGVERSNNLVKAKPADSDVNETAVQDRQTIKLNRKVGAFTEVACNEETHPNKWLAVFQEIGSLWKSKGGLVD
jgi:hypothetical protein